MKSLKEFINEASTKMTLDNKFFALYKSKSPEEFRTKLLEIKSMATGKKLNTKKNKYLMSIRNPRDSKPVETYNHLDAQSTLSYSLSSSISNENKYFIAFCVDDISDFDETGIIEFGKHPRIYFGNNKKFIEYKWDYVFNDVKWDYYGGKKGINDAKIPTAEIYEMPDSLIEDCIQDLETFKNKSKKYNF